MKIGARHVSPRGPFTADQLHEGDPYELSQGHPVECLPTGARGGRANLLGGAVLEADPAVEQAGIDTGFAPERGTMRAPDIAVGNVPDEPGWVRGAPPLAVEYADTGQDEENLQTKIGELLQGGTRMVWVVRLSGPRRVEIYEPETRMRTVLPGEELFAPGILRNPVRVEALYDREAAHEAILRNLLQRRGYENLDSVKEEGQQQGRIVEARAAIRRVLARRGLSVGPAEQARVDACEDLATLERWHDEAVTAKSAAEALG